jgi:hypothetical protein
MSPEARARAEALTREMLAEALHIQQPAVAKLEKRTDKQSTIVWRARKPI